MTEKRWKLSVPSIDSALVQTADATLCDWFEWAFSAIRCTRWRSGEIVTAQRVRIKPPSRIGQVFVDVVLNSIRTDT